MRKIIVLTFLSMDGVLQAPGGPEEDTSGDFKYGGWVAPYGDKVFNDLLSKEMRPSELLLGRNTFDIFASYWPEHGDRWPGVNDVRKYVLSTTLQKSDWNNSTILKSVEDIRKLKNSEGSDIQVWGSGKLVQTLLENDLVDEMSLKIFPLILGNGKKIWSAEAIPAAFTLVSGVVTENGIILAHYRRSGEIKTGAIGEE